MKYSTLFIIISILLVIFPWTGLPFGFIRLVISGTGLIICFLSVGLYQKEQKISQLLHDLRNKEHGVYQKEHTTTQEVSDVQPQVQERKKLSDVL